MARPVGRGAAAARRSIADLFAVELAVVLVKAMVRSFAAVWRRLFGCFFLRWPSSSVERFGLLFAAFLRPARSIARNFESFNEFFSATKRFPLDFLFLFFNWSEVTVLPNKAH